MPLAAFDADAKPELFSASILKKRTNAGHVTPSHPFFDAADALLVARRTITGRLERARKRLLRDLIVTVGPDLRRRKRDRRVIAFDDMLYNLHAALESGDHGPLVDALRDRFPVALIDEFQDTDPLQFAIFDRLYAKGRLPAFFVGDPKQAIYSFRNADLHAYLGARRRASNLYTLTANQRSTEGLIKALNGLFSARPNAFMLPGLDYHPVAPGDRERPAFIDTSLPRADLHVWTLPCTPEGQPVTKDAARALSVGATAAEIARLLTEARKGHVKINGRELRAGDIAVLVRTHAQGSAQKRELDRLGIGSVELSQASVYRSPDAEEVERVLIAINAPSRDALLRGALATELMGCDAARVAEIASNERELMSYVERFAGYRDIWLRQGVGIMYRRFLTDEQISARMLAARMASGASPTCCTWASKSTRRPLTHDRRTHCCAGWPRSGATALPTKSRNCASNPTAILSRSSPSTRPRASSSRLCSARSCGTAIPGSAGRSPKAASITRPTAPPSSIFEPTTRSRPRRPSLTPRQGRRPRRSHCVSSTWR